MGASILVALPVAPARAAVSGPPYTECPAVGYSSSCRVLIEITDAGANVYTDPAQGTYDGSDDTLVGVINDSSKPVDALALRSPTYIFGFDGDGLCTYNYSMCFGPTGYEGPDTTFSDVSPDATSGVVNFTSALAPGQSTYFGLEDSLSSANVQTGSGQSPVAVHEQGAAPNQWEYGTTCSSGDPVNCATGELWETVTDLVVPGRGPALSLARTYNSLDATADGPLGHGWSFSYGMHLSVDGAGNVTVVSGDGATVTFAPAPYWYGTVYTAPARVLASLAANSDGSWTLTDDRSRQRDTFDSSGRLIAQADRNGQTTTLAYGNGQLQTVTDPAGRQLQFAYGPGGRIASVTDPAGRVVSYGYDGAGDLTTVTDVAGGVTRYGYDTAHLLTSVTDALGATSSTVYDSAGRVVSQTDPAGRTTTWSYTGDPTGATGSTTTITDPRGIATTHAYANLQLTSVTKAAGTAQAATWSYSYDPFVAGISSVTDPDGHTARYTYDRSGDVLTATDALGRKTTIYYNGMSEPYLVRDPAGNALLDVGYDYNGNVISVQRGDGSAGRTLYGYTDPSLPGAVTAVTDPAGATTRYGYDSAGDITSVADPAGDTTTFGYDGIGRRLSAVSPRGNATGADPGKFTTTYGYDAFGDLTTVTDPLGHTTTNGYDADRRLTSRTDPAGNTTRYGYNPDGQPVAVTRADGSILRYGYTPDGMQAAQYDAAGNTTTYGYDALDRVTSITDPLGRATTYTYDPVGNVTAVTDPRGITTTSTYDAANELTGVGYSDATPAVGFSYDQDARRASTTDATGTTSYGYDGAGRISAVTDGAGNTVGYGYDTAGRLASLTYPDGLAVSRGYDAAGRLVSIGDGHGNTTAITPNADGATTTVAYPNGVTATSTLDATDAPIAIADTNTAGTLASFAYTRDGNGQVTSDTSTGTGQPAQTYSYNSLNELTGVNAFSYGYNNADELVKLLSGATQTFDAAGQLQAQTGNGGASIGYSYDAAGDRTGSAGAGGATGPGACAICVLSPTGTALSAAGNSSITSSGAITVDSTATTAALSADGKAGIAAAHIYTPGGVTTNGSKATIAPAPTSGTTGNPLTTATPSASGTASSIAVGDGAAHTAGPGVYASITVSSGTLTLDSGAYVITGGLSVSGKGTVKGTNATIYLACASYPSPCAGPASGAGIDLTGGRFSLADSTATAIGADPANAAAIAITGNAAADIAGNIDTPAAGITVGGNASLAVAGRIAAATVSTTGTATITDTAPAVTTTTTTGVTYTYDALHRLTTSTTSAGTTTYAYDGDGLRTASTSPTATTHYTWQTADTAVPLLLSDGTYDYVYDDNGTPIERITSGGTAATYYQHDQLGSTRLLTDQTGAVVATYGYDPYGNLTTHTGNNDTPLRFAGQYQDPTGLYYLRARYYDPSTAQFLTRDPLIPLTQQAYNYANNNPLNTIDPLGLCGHWYDVACQFGSAATTVGGAIATGATAVGNAAYSAGAWVDDHAGDISAATGAIAVVIAPIPGLDIASLVLGGISVGTGALATGNDIAKGEWKQAVVDGLGTLVGAGGLGADLAARGLMSGAREAWDAADLGAAARLSHASEAAEGYGKVFDRTAAGAAAFGLWTDHSKFFGESGEGGAPEC